MIYKLIVIFAVLAAAGAQMLLKKGASIEYPNIARQYLNPWVIGGYSIMFLAMAVNIFAMNRGVQVKEVSTIESLSYLFVPCLSWLIFGEQLSRRKVIAIGVIICGVIVFFINN